MDRETIGRGRLQRLQDNVYFVVEPSSFHTTISVYDEVLANQTILFSPPQFDKGFSPVLETEEIHENIDGTPSIEP
jgi:hypothetical protein